MAITDLTEPCLGYECIYENILNDLDDVSNIQDDIIVFGSSEDEHAERLRLVLERIFKAKVKLNKAKCQFWVKKLKFVSHIFSAEG